MNILKTTKHLAGLCFMTSLLASTSIHANNEGYISAKEAFDWASNDENVVILDVRTGEEWRWVGHPGANGLVESNNGNANGLDYKSGANLIGKVFNIAYMIQKDDDSKGLIVNANFVQDVTDKFEDGTTTLLLICRSGDRSDKAALLLETEASLITTYTINHGFQGDKNDEDQPGLDTNYRDANGWVNDGLPWNQNTWGYVPSNEL